MSDAERLLAAVYANPHDLEARAVYGDCLEAIGDRRGELIALQLIEKPTKAQARRARELVRFHRGEWLGELREVLQRKALVFRHGFPYSGRLAVGGQERLATLVGHPAWSTFRELDVNEGSGAQVTSGFLEAPSVRRGLRAVKGLSVFNLAALASSSRPWSIERIGLCPTDWWQVGADTFDAIRYGEALEEIRSLELGRIWHEPNQASWLLGSALWLRASRVRIELAPSVTVAWLRELERFIDRQGAAIVNAWYWELRIEASEQGTTLTAKADSTLVSNAYPRDLFRNALAAFSSGFLTEVVVQPSTDTPFDDAMVAFLERCIDARRVAGRVLVAASVGDDVA